MVFVLTSLLERRGMQDGQSISSIEDANLFIRGKGVPLLVYTNVLCHKEICRSLLHTMCVLIKTYYERVICKADLWENSVVFR